MKVWVVENKTMRCVDTAGMKIFIDNKGNMALEDNQGNGTGYLCGEWFDKEHEAERAFLNLQIELCTYHIHECHRIQCLDFPGEATCLTSDT